MTERIRIIDNKRLLLTNDEFEQYRSICRSYDRPNFKGEHLFKGLFNSDNDGIILNLNPPGNGQQLSFEIFLYLIKIMVHQHMRIVRQQNLSLMKETQDNIANMLQDLRKEKEELKVLRLEVASLINKAKATKMK